MNLEFRVYHKQEERYGTRCDLDDHRIDYDFNCGMVNLEFAIKHPQWYIVEQWTGFSDKNKVKIFDGDIVKVTTEKGPDNKDLHATHWQGEERIHLVKWDSFSNGEYVDEVQCWMLQDFYPLSELFSENFYKYKKWIRTFEIIGNIRENKDLLNDRK